MTIEQIKNKIEIGDFVLVSKLLNISAENARIRFLRGKEDVIDALKTIILNREILIRDYRNFLETKSGNYLGSECNLNRTL